MGTKEVTMETKYAAVFASVQAGRESVTGVCDRLGISRKSYYKYLGRFCSEGLEGLRPRSRRPLSSPESTPPQMVWRASQIPDSGPNKVRSGMEDGECKNGARNSPLSLRTRR